MAAAAARESRPPGWISLLRQRGQKDPEGAVDEAAAPASAAPAEETEACLPPGVTARAIREELARILSSRAFHHSERLKRFLFFATEETLRGRADRMKEYVLGIEVFDRKDFDPRLDAVVRVEAGRLRTRLQRYYETEGQRDEIVIELPKGSYAVVFRLGTSPVGRDAREQRTQKRIAVLPFIDRSPTQDQGYFCDGLTEALIEALTKVDDLRVSAFSPAASPKGGYGTATEIGKRLQADWAVEGWLRRDGPLAKVAVRLVDVARDSIVRSESFERDIQEIFELQDEMAKAILRALQPRFAAGEAWSPAKRQTKDSTAYRHYLKGRHHWNKRTQEGLHESILHFERALQQDARYALALAGLADAYALLGNYGVLPTRAVREKAQEAAFAAAAIDPELAEARTSKAHIHATYEWNWTLAEQEYEQAIRLSPWYATAHHWYAVTCLMPLRRLDEALLEILEAQDLDPVSSSIGRDTAVVFYSRREFERAVQQARKRIDMDPAFPENYWILGLGLEQKGLFGEAIQAMEKCAALRRTPRIIGALGHACAAAGRTAEAEACVRELEELAARRYVSPFDQAVISMGLGPDERTVEWLQRACQFHCYELAWLRVDPRFDRLRSHPSFEAVVRSVGLYSAEQGGDSGSSPP